MMKDALKSAEQKCKLSEAEGQGSLEPMMPNINHLIPKKQMEKF